MEMIPRTVIIPIEEMLKKYFQNTKKLMSGGHFNYNQCMTTEIADTIAIEIARALLPKPQKVHEDYWTIYEHECPCSYHN